MMFLCNQCISALQDEQYFVCVVRHNVLLNGTLKDRLELERWFATGLIVTASVPLY